MKIIDFINTLSSNSIHFYELIANIHVKHLIFYVHCPSERITLLLLFSSQVHTWTLCDGKDLHLFGVNDNYFTLSGSYKVRCFADT